MGKDFKKNDFLFIIYIFVVTYYIIWRFNFTLEWHVVMAPIMFVADLILILNSVIFLYTSRKTYIPEQKLPLRNKTVDILIPTYNEPNEIVISTVRAALAVRGVRNVLLLDDGNREHLKNSVEPLGARYYSRGNAQYAKAGNMNFGLQHTDAEFVAFFDCDHMPLSSFIEDTLGYFEDEKLAFVQTPQVFYNLDSIQHRKTNVRPTWNEQTMFYESIQPSKNSFNAAFFCGSSAMFRRSAIDSVGGFSTETATEDIHTSIRIHARGWKSLFIPKRLAFGLAPEDMTEYHKQRVRWGAGSLGLLLRSKDSPLLIKGLTFKQRLAYFHSTLAHMMGVYKLMYILMPAFTIFFINSQNTFPLETYFTLHILFVAFSYYITMQFSQWTFHFPYTEQFDIFNILPQIEALKGVIKIQKKFSVSIKLKSVKSNGKAFIFFGSLLILTLAANIYGITQIVGYHAQSLYIPLFWNAINMFFLTTIIYFLIMRSRKVQNNLIPYSQAIQVEASPIRPAHVQAMSKERILLDLPELSAKENIKVILNHQGNQIKINSSLEQIVMKKDSWVKAVYAFNVNPSQQKEFVSYFLHMPVAQYFHDEQISVDLK